LEVITLEHSDQENIAESPTRTIDPCPETSPATAGEASAVSCGSRNGKPPEQESWQSYGHFTAEKCKHGRWVILTRNISNEMIFKRVYITCQSYSCPACRKQRRRKLYKLIKKACPKDKFSMLTLTLRENDDPLSINWKRLSKCWDILLKRMKRAAPNIQYFRCVELQENGMPHIHALINFYMPKWLIHAIWKRITGDSFICRFEHVKRSCAGYILYYFEKAVSDINYIRSATGKKTRIFNWSRHLLCIVKDNPTWKLVEVCTCLFDALEIMEDIKQSSRNLYGRHSPFNILQDSAGRLLEFSFLSAEV
jgi:hypothetical protein